MMIRLTYKLLFCILLASLGSCVEKAKPAAYQTLHLYTDFPESFSNTFFRDFGRKNHLHVQVHHFSSEEIIKRVKQKKYESEIDAVILRNALDLIKLNNIRGIQAPKEETDFYQAILHDPYVFQFPNDKVPLFTSYGQIFRSDRVKVYPDSIRDPKEWGNLLGGLIQKYPTVEPEKIYQTILKTDSIKGKKLKQVIISRHSTYTNTKGLIYPDQYFKGSVGMIAGLGLIRQSKNRSNALLLYDYCKNDWWRKKLANKLNLFPIVSEEDNKNADLMLFQGLVKKSSFLKKMQQ